MKVITPKQMKALEQEAYRDGASENDFMEEAGSGVGLVVHEFAERFGLERQVILLCGQGNNAGDAYVAGIHLLHLDYNVHAYQLYPLSDCSKLCQENASRFQFEGGIISNVGYDDEIPYPLDGLIIDGIFGTGFHGEVEEPIASYIVEANESGLPIISVDIPSGLDGETGEIRGPVILAAETAFLGLPKQGFFLKNGWDVVGKLRHVDFGLGEEYIEETVAPFEMLTDEMMLPLLPSYKRSRNKYEAGYVVALAGSPGMPGAAILSSFSSLRGGAGIVRLLHPEGMESELAAAHYELIKTPYNPDKPKEVLEWMKKASSVFLGPGLGKSPVLSKLLLQILPHIKCPLVLDADALNIIAANSPHIPEGAILTPHLGEMQRLLNLKEVQPIDLPFLQQCQKYTEDKNITLVLKGGPTFIFHPLTSIRISPVGDPGMATAGTGDVLTGLIASLLAQGLKPLDAACLGVYIHGIAGEQAALEMTSYCMVASDLFDFFPSAFAFVTR